MAFEDGCETGYRRIPGQAEVVDIEGALDIAADADEGQAQIVTMDQQQSVLVGLGELKQVSEPERQDRAILVSMCGLYI